MQVVILGKGGHAGGLADIIRQLHITWRMEDGDKVGPGECPVIGLGDIEKRKKLYKQFKPTLNVIHPSAVIAPPTGIHDEGAIQIMAGVVIQTGASIGKNTLVNPRASIDHGCVIGPHCHIAPGAILCGDVTLGEGCFIGAGATIIQGVELEPGTFVPAGTLVVGQDNMRRPVRVVHGDGTFAAKDSEESGPLTPSVDQRVHTHLQPREPIVVPVSTECSRSDV